jgi:hypothetical protein
VRVSIAVIVTQGSASCSRFLTVIPDDEASTTRECCTIDFRCQKNVQQSRTSSRRASRKRLGWRHRHPKLRQGEIPRVKPPRWRWAVPSAG